MSLEQIKAAVARVTTPPNSVTQGTAFLVGEQFVLTCAHCIETDSSGEDLAPQLDFTEWPEQVKRSFEPSEVTLVLVDRTRDLALLKLPEPLPAGVRSLELASDAMLGDSWQSFAYPAPVGDDGLPLEGTIEDTQGRSHGKPRLTLRCKQAADRVHGASGGPIVSGAYVVGILNQQLRARDDTGTVQTSYQIVYGVRCAEIRAVFPTLPMVDTGPFSALDVGVSAAQGDYLCQFLGFYFGTKALPVGFGGRGDRLKELEHWLGDDTHPFGLLVSPAGRGKSALLVRWSEMLRIDRRARVAFVPVSLRYETARLLDTATVLLTRLRRLLGLAGPPLADASTAREEIARLCKDTGKCNTPLVVVLDGLDEALDWRYAYSRLGLPPVLPPGFRVLGTCRTDPNATPIEIVERLGWPHGSVTIFEELLPLSPGGVGEALASITPSGITLPAGITPELLHYLSNGDPLLLGLYLDQVANRLATNELEGLASELRVQEPGWRDYLVKWWEGQRKLWGGDLEDRRAATLLCLLIAARGPLTRDDLVALSTPLDEKERVDGFVFRTVLETVGRLVTPVCRSIQQGDDRVALTLSHPQLAPFLRDLFVEQYGLDCARFDIVLVKWCRQVKAELLGGQTAPENVPAYILRHLPEHLTAANATDELADLLGEHWRAARRRVDGSDDGFLNDVTQAWTAVERSWLEEEGDAQGGTNSAVRLVRCALLATSGLAVRGWPADLVVAMARLDRWSEQAMLAALQRLDCHRHSVIHAFGHIRERLTGRALADLVEDAHAEPLLKLAAVVEIARREDASDLGPIVACAGGMSTETAEAQALLAPWLNPSQLAQTVNALRNCLVDDGGHVGKAVHDALQVADALEGEARQRQLDAIRGVRQSATPLANGLLDMWGFAPLLIASLSVKEKAMTSEALIEALDAINTTDLREKRTAQVAEILASGHGAETALSRVRSIKNPFLRAKGLARIARERQDPNLVDEAVAAASDHQDSLACAAAALELARLAGDDDASTIVDGLGGLIRASLEDPTSQEAWAWAALGKLMTQADRDGLCDGLLPMLHSERDHTAGEVLAAILPYATPAILETALAFATDPANSGYTRGLIVRAVGARLDATRLAELWQSHADQTDTIVLKFISVPLACKGTDVQADSVIDWCVRKSLRHELADIVREAPESIARRAWQAILTRREDGDWMNTALRSGTRFPGELSLLIADVVAAGEKATAMADSYSAYWVLVEGVLPVIPRGEAIGLRAARLAGQLIAAHHADTGGMPLPSLDLGWRAQLAVRLPPGAERGVLLDDALTTIDQAPYVWGRSRLSSHPWATHEEFGRLLVQSLLETTADSLELGSVIESFGDWPLRLPLHSDRFGKPAELPLELLCTVPVSTLRPIWARSLRDFASQGRASLARALTVYAPLVQQTGGADAALQLARELLALPHWWP